METQEKPGVDGAEPGGHGHSLGTPVAPEAGKRQQGLSSTGFGGGNMSLSTP